MHLHRSWIPGGRDRLTTVLAIGSGRTQSVRSTDWCRVSMNRTDRGNLQMDAAPGRAWSEVEGQYPRLKSSPHVAQRVQSDSTSPFAQRNDADPNAPFCRALLPDRRNSRIGVWGAGPVHCEGSRETSSVFIDREARHEGPLAAIHSVVNWIVIRSTWDHMSSSHSGAAMPSGGHTPSRRRTVTNCPR